MEYLFDNDRPIYIQLVEMLRMEIISGNLQSGQKLPSVREFAMIAKVNPNTMQKALAELEREGLVYTERTNGKFITNDISVIDNLKLKFVNDRMDSFLADMNNIGISNEDVIRYLQMRQ